MSKMDEENDRDNEIKELKSKLDKVQKENENLKKFNEDLRNQVKLLTGKLNLFQQLNNTLNTTSSSNLSSTKTETPSSNKTKNDHNDWMQESINKKMKITELVTNIAQQNVSINDYIYDKHSKTYYSKSSGWFYYEERNLFYDPNSKNYYSYDRTKNTFTFHSTLNDVLKQTKEEKKKESKLNKKDDEDDWEDGEILSSGNESNNEDEESKPSIDENDYIQPCIRLIVQQAHNLDLGSLLIITVKGASIGRLDSCELQLDEQLIDDLHAKVVWSDNDHFYYIEDLNSQNGTFINDNQIKTNHQTRLKHLDILRLGDVEFLVHIHDKNNSCVHCEPGCVQAKLKSSMPTVLNNDLSLSKEEKEKMRKKELKSIMKKFGINKYESSEVLIGGNYQDRASERRKIKGSSSDHFKTEQISLDKPIDENNKGAKLLAKMGYKKDESKDTKLIEIKPKDNRFGLGFD